mmetsp:Transcript_26951/g.58891  ORF Transcript_26951/g.58891 Transcript_26951/m.58891 type:complete len:176 (-) Transcript_26951:340-867(-)
MADCAVEARQLSEMGDSVRVTLVDHTITLRTARPDDLQTLVKFNQAMAKETENLELPDIVITEGVKAVLEGRPAATYFVAEDCGSVVGQTMITREWSDWRAKDLWWIQSVYVDPAYRKQGVFKQLYQYVRQRAQAAGAAGLRLYADTSNASAHAAYERLGMTSHYKVYEDMFTSY